MENEPQQPQSPDFLELSPHKNFTLRFIFVMAGIIILGGSAYIYSSYLARKSYDEVSKQAQLAEEKGKQNLEYRNELFGFYIPLPEGWRGYTVNHIKEDIYDVTGKTTTNNGVIDSFQLIEVHHPSDIPDSAYETMPIMVFTHEQWEYVQKGEWSVGAAPIAPSVLGQNSKYILALPARYNYDFAPGWEEVDVLVHKLQAFEPVTNSQSEDASSWQTYRNEEYGLEFKYPGDWVVEKLDEFSPNEIISLRQIDDDGGFGVISINGKNRIINETELLEGLKLLDRSEVIYDGLSWKILIATDEREESLQFISAFTYKNNATYSLGGRYYKNRELLYNQILSTFKFIK